MLQQAGGYTLHHDKAIARTGNGSEAIDFEHDIGVSQLSLHFNDIFLSAQILNEISYAAR